MGKTRYTANQDHFKLSGTAMDRQLIDAARRMLRMERARERVVEVFRRGMGARPSRPMEMERVPPLERSEVVIPIGADIQGIVPSPEELAARAQSEARRGEEGEAGPERGPNESHPRRAATSRRDPEDKTVTPTPPARTLARLLLDLAIAGVRLPFAVLRHPLRAAAAIARAGRDAGASLLHRGLDDLHRLRTSSDATR